MRDNIFNPKREYRLDDYMSFNTKERDNLGEELPVLVYRLMEYSVKEALTDAYGKEAQIEIFRRAGYKAGKYFAEKLLALSLPFNEFVAQLQSRLSEYKIGVMRIESIDNETGRIVLSVAEDADCSGLPLLGETVCNYDEGFIAAILSVYTGRDYYAVETDCWATGDRVCRFCAEIKE